MECRRKTLLVVFGTWLASPLCAYSQVNLNNPNSSVDSDVPATTLSRQREVGAPSPSASPSASPIATMPAPLPEETKISPLSPISEETEQAPSASKAKPLVITGRLAELKLSNEQTQAIIEIRKQWRPELEKRLRQELLTAKQNLATAMADATPSEEVHRYFDEMQKKYLELQTFKFEKLLKIRDVLSLDQRRKFSEIRNKTSVSSSGTP